MLSARLFCLVALLPLFSSAIEINGWILLQNGQGFARHEQKLRSEHDFRGLYGDQRRFALLWGSADEAESLREEFSDAEVLFREALPVVSNYLRYALLEFSSVDYSRVVKDYLFSIEDFVVMGNSEFAVVMFPETVQFEWPAEVEVVVAPSEALPALPSKETAAAYKIFQNSMENDIIHEYVAKVSQTELFNNIDHLSNAYHTRQSASNDIREAQKWIESEYAARGLTVSTHNYSQTYSDNVIGELRGSVNPDQIVIVGAHYDSRTVNSGSTTDRAPGADDNGSGSSAMLEISRVLTQNITFANTIRFLSFSGEEQGLLGSDAYAKFIKSRGDNVIAMFNADMLGYRIPGSEISLGMKDRSVTEWLVEMTMEISVTYVPDLTVGYSSSCCSDYISFYNQGYPAAGYFENLQGASSYPQYHTSNDVVENLDFKQIQMHTQAVMAAVMTFAEPL